MNWWTKLKLTVREWFYVRKRRMYVVTMYRYGDRENHSYVLGVYTSIARAVVAAANEESHRGGNKYFSEVLEFPVNGRRMDHRAIITLR